jgi:hypothetical protein
MIDGPIRHQPRTLAEVRRPSAQNPIELIAHFLPKLDVTASEQM